MSPNKLMCTECIELRKCGGRIEPSARADAWPRHRTTQSARMAAGSSKKQDGALFLVAGRRRPEGERVRDFSH
eukprot:scaffold4985_cov116-Isochrysis_galbana.AAC.2